MKLLTLLKALQPDELKDFEKFLASPFFKAGEQQLVFFKILCKHHPGFEVGKAELATAYRRCFGKDSYTDAKLYNLMSGMAKQVEDFMAIKLVLNSETGHQREALLVRALGQRKTGSYYRTEAQRLADALEKKAVKSKDDYLLLEQLYSEAYFNPDTSKHKPQAPHLDKGMEQLDLFYAASKLRYAAEMLARERLFSEKHEIPMLDALLHFTDGPVLVESHPLPALYNRLVRLYLVGVNEDGFRALQALFMKLHSHLPKNDQAVILAHLINCGIALGRMDVEVNAELLSLYKLAIEAEAVMDNGRITYTAYSNIVLLAVACGELDWAAGFMQRFSPYLADSVREPTEQFCRAHIHHASGELNKAQDCLGQAVFTTPAFDVIARSLLMKILFERYAGEGKDYEFLFGHLNAFEKYIEAKQLSEERRRAYLNAIRFVRKMVGIKSKHVNVTAKERGQLQGKLTETSPITMRNWLRQQIDRF